MLKTSIPNSNLRDNVQMYKVFFELCKGVCLRDRGGKKKKQSLDLAWVGPTCRPAFKITSVSRLYKKHGPPLLRILTEE